MSSLGIEEGRRMERSPQGPGLCPTCGKPTGPDAVRTVHAASHPECFAKIVGDTAKVKFAPGQVPPEKRKRRTAG